MICRRSRQLKELEELRVQLSLPGAEAAVEAAEHAAEAGTPIDAAAGADADVDADTDADVEAGGAAERAEAADASQSRPQGLVARGVDDDAH